MNDLCDWHVLIVEGQDDEQQITVLHPEGCPFYAEFGMGDRNSPWHNLSYMCFIGQEIANAGYDTLLADFQWKPPIVAVPHYMEGWYKTRGGWYTVQFAEGTETDIEAETVGIRWREQKKIVDTIRAM